MELEGTALVFKRCHCMTVRDAMAAISRSGLPSETLRNATFDTWETVRTWQKNALDMAKSYVSKAQDPAFNAWFILCGTPGCGKTKLCSTVFRALLEAGRTGQYITWRDLSRRAKAVANDWEEFHKIMEPLKKTPMLYIDDFWKGSPSPADVGLTFELLNDRYVSGKMTIISSELTLETIMRGDEAIGSRLMERSEGYYMDLSRAENWRKMMKQRGA